MKEVARLETIECKDRVVLVRCDFNEPVDSTGKLEDDYRIKAALPTIRFLRRKGAKVVLATHVGRPSGKQRKFSTKPHAEHLSRLLRVDVAHVSDCIGSRVEKRVHALKSKQVLLLENLRFYEEESSNDKDFGMRLARLAHAYVNEAFSNSHRRHASMTRVTQYLPSYAGIRLVEEVDEISGLASPKKPFVVVMGGAKVSDKIQVIEQLAKRANKILVGGAMMFTFLAAQGVDVHKSHYEKDKLDVARMLLRKYGRQLVIAHDCVAARRLDDSGKVFDVEELAEDMMGLDIGPKSAALFTKHILSAKTVFWNGPLGLTEYSSFKKGSAKIAKAIKQSGAHSVIGGGDTVSFLRQAKLSSCASFMSTGGGAALALVARKPMPGLEVLGFKL